MTQSKMFAFLLTSLFGLASIASVSGCTPVDDDDAADDDDATGDDDDATGDDDDATGDDDDDDALCDDLDALRTDALDEGEQILDGVSLEESTPIADLNADPASFQDQLVQIEGLAFELCASQGCWTTLVDPVDGERMNIKVEDGAVDFREFIEIGVYVVADGVFDEFGGHGEQVFIGAHGAMVGTIQCY